MSLRIRMVAALTALFAVGLTVYGVGTYRAFAGAELARLDDDLRTTLPLVARELVAPDALLGRLGPAGPGWRDRPGRVVVAPGTYAELRGPSGQVVDTLQVSDAGSRPDLTGIQLSAGDQLLTVGSADGTTGTWRVAVVDLPDGGALLAAAPMARVEDALARLLAIETVAGLTLLALLASGAWLILRSGLRPIERMSTTAGSISAGSLDVRVGGEDTDSEVGQLARALNGMLDDLEDAFLEREATEAKLRRFLADASHELRTPLTSIQGFAELFRLGPESEHVDLPTIMRRIEEESGRMRRLVEDLLTLARLDETHPAERRTVDLAVLAADACSDAVAHDPGRPVRLDAPTPVPVTGDAGHLRQAIGNLVANAIRHTPPGTAVEVTTAIHNGSAWLTVRDHGTGLDQEALARAFDRFWQADPARAGTGTGLGLSIVEAIMAEHGGKVSADNAPDGGALFTITIPTSPGAAPKDPT